MSRWQPPTLTTNRFKPTPQDWQRITAKTLELAANLTRATERAALQDLREKLVRKWEDIGLEIQDIDHQLETRER